MFNEEIILKYIKNIFFIYIVSIGFNDILYLPYFERKIQIPEVLILIGICPLLLLFLANKIINYSFICTLIKKTNYIDYTFIFYIFSIILSDILGNHTHSITTILGFIYLSFIFCLTKYLFLYNSQHNTSFWDKIQYSIIFLGVLQSLISIIGWTTWYLTDWSNSTVQLRTSYLYFGAVARSQGTTGDPNMLATISSVSLFFIWNLLLKKNYRDRFLWGLFLVCFVAILLSMSRLILLTSAILIFIYIFHKKTTTIPLLKSLSILLILSHLLVTHFYITLTPILPQEVNKGGGYIGDNPIISFENIQIYETAYTCIKKGSIHLFLKNLPWGVGLGQQEHACDVLKSTNDYPKNLMCYDPHCTYTGAFAETGILGGISFLLLVTMLIYTITNMLMYWNKEFIIIYLVPIAVVLFYTLEGTGLENSTFRHHWVCFGLLSGIFTHYKQANRKT